MLFTKIRSIASMTSKTFLFWVSNEQSNFVLPEMESLFKLFEIDSAPLSNRRMIGPFLLMSFSDEAIPKKLMSRSFLIHSCYEVLEESNSLQSLHEKLRSGVEKFKPFISSSFRIRIESFGKTIRQNEKIQFINEFSYLPLEGRVDLQNPTCSLHLLMYFGLDHNNVPDNPYNLFFTRWVADGQRKLVTKLNLKDRKFIGNTSMDPLLSLLMANLSLVKENDIVLDPFVGTGSILVAAASLGAYVVGSDIDYLMLHGRTKSTRAFQTKRCDDESIRSNLEQYGLGDKYLDVIVSDASRSLWRDDMKFNAILTDPPYGIREATEKLGTAKIREPDFKIKEEYLEKHIPSKQEYALTEVYSDLMNFSVKRLELGGRLGFWIPISRTEYDENMLPSNPCLELVFNYEQVLTSFASRRLLIFQKIQEPVGDSVTKVDGTALMYRFKFFEGDRSKDARRSRKQNAFESYGRAYKRGQLTS